MMAAERRAAQVQTLDSARDRRRGLQLVAELHGLVINSDLTEPGWLFVSQHLHLIGDEIVERIVEMEKAA